MKRNYEFMASREVKVFLQKIDAQWGSHPKAFKEQVLVKGKEKIYLISRGIDGVPLNKLRINNIGLYIAEVKDEQVRLSIEGSRLVGEVATKNVIEFTRDEAKAWLRGEDMPRGEEFQGFSIIKCGDDFLGTCKWKEGRILNFVPKARRLVEIH
ncbi:hypothetical protein C4580_05370 [Candidatus Woesearchaeota archaeon]|nr:MAG: hypothetical protein C4580_05370 [Candidatus Woesearchaeota archaeon]